MTSSTFTSFKPYIPQWRLSCLRSLSIRQICNKDFAYSLSLCVIVSIIVLDLDLNFQDHKFETLTARKLWVLLQKDVIRLLQRFIFAIEWHHCASNILLLLIKRLLLGDALATITNTFDHFCSDKNLALSEWQRLSQELHLIPVFIVEINATDWNAVFLIKIKTVRKHN